LSDGRKRNKLVIIIAKENTQFAEFIKKLLANKYFCIKLLATSSIIISLTHCYIVLVEKPLPSCAIMQTLFTTNDHTAYYFYHNDNSIQL